MQEFGRIFVTSDHHFGHENIIKYCDRPFESVQDMDDSMVSKWNSTVSDVDTVYHLGDVSLSGSLSYVGGIFERLNGNIQVLAVPWHHDSRWLVKDGRFASKSGIPVAMLSPVEVLSFPGYGNEGRDLVFTLSHYPMAEWEASHYGYPHLHGHSHGAYSDPFGRPVFDVGVDCNEYAPVSIDVFYSRWLNWGNGDGRKKS